MQITLDVSELEPCEPLEQTLAATQVLKPGEYLRILHRREPNLLFPILEKAGFQWQCFPGDESLYEVIIWRKGDEQAGNEAAQYASSKQH